MDHASVSIAAKRALMAKDPTLTFRENGKYYLRYNRMDIEIKTGNSVCLYFYYNATLICTQVFERALLEGDTLKVSNLSGGLSFTIT